MYFLNKLKNYLRLLLNKKRGLEALGYNIGNKKFHNSMIDGLVPGLVTIGDNFVSAPGSIVLAHDASTFLHSGKYRVEKTKLGDNVFLGANSIVMPGVTIGDNVIVGAGSVVTRNLESNAVYAGNPAKLMCSVDTYIKKCEEKGCLIVPPTSFSEQFNNKKISNEDITEFNDMCVQYTRERK